MIGSNCHYWVTGPLSSNGGDIIWIMILSYLGGGIAGLTTAIALQKEGYRVKVFERT